MNDSVKCVFKDGTVKIFNSVEGASKELNLSINTINLRCNREVEKDGMTLSWNEASFKRSKIAKRNRNKGNGFELEIIKALKSIGFTGCVSSRSQSKRTDDNKIDIMDLDDKLPCNIQTKFTQNTPNYFSIRDKCTDKSKPFTVIWKKSGVDGHNSPGTVAIIPVEYFYELLSDSCFKTK